MKIFINKLTVLALFTALLFAGCKRELTEGIDTVINTNIYVAPTVISFVNANETSPVQPKDFTVTITGKDAAKVVMQSGGTNFKVVGGMLQLALLNTAIPTATSPITFNVNVAIDSFAPTSHTITISDTTSTLKTIQMVDYYNPVAGTAAIITTGNLNNGASTSIQTIATTINSTTTETAKITIPTGTIMQDASGNVINASNVKTSLVYFGNGTSTSLAAFPGGLSPKNVIGANGQPIVDGVNFITAGLASIKMTAGNTEVKKFNTPIQVEMQLNASMENPSTGATIKVGDKVPVWSLNEETGQWKYESEATIVNDVNGKPSVKFPVAHLSAWNLDWWWSDFGGFGTCNKSLKINITTDDKSTLPTGPYEIVLCQPGYNPPYVGGRFNWFASRGYFAALHYTNLYHGFSDIITTVPSANSAQVIVLNNRTGKVEARSATFNPCSNNSITLNITRPAPPKIFTVNLLAYGKCSNKNALSYFNGWLYFQKVGSYYGQYVYSNYGRSSFQLEDGANYYIWGIDYTTYKSAYGYGTVSSSIVGNFTVNGLTCVGTYNAATSIYNLTITQNVVCK